MRITVLLVTLVAAPGWAEAVRARMERLSRLTDVIYVHIDMDVLDPDRQGGR